MNGDAKRWDTDERGRGVGDARASLPALNELTELAGTADWVAEEPEQHLMPHLRSGFEAAGMVIETLEVRPSGLFAVKVRAPKRSRGELRKAVWGVLGGLAELSTHVREKNEGEVVVFEIVTGIPPGGRFATHGHTLRVEVEPG